MTPDARVQELLPCPFCGGEATLYTADHPSWKLSRVFCRACGHGGSNALAADAIAAWNRRSTPETERMRDLVRQQRMELHAAKLISDAEYAALASDSGAIQRLASYDQAIHAVEEETERLRSAQDAVWNEAILRAAAVVDDTDVIESGGTTHMRQDDGRGTLVNARNAVLDLLRPPTPTRDPR